jgi:hypothetical protein
MAFSTQQLIRRAHQTSFSISEDAQDTVTGRDRIFSIVSIHGVKLIDVYSLGIFYAVLLFHDWRRNTMELSDMIESGRLIRSIQNWIHQVADLDPLQ